jgi:hypothetical protein
MPVSEVVPKLDGELAEDVNVHTPPSSVVFDEIGKLGWKHSDLAEMFEEAWLVPSGGAIAGNRERQCL